MAAAQELHDIPHMIAPGDNKNILDARLLEACNRMKHHGIVAHGQQMLVGYCCQGRQTGTGATCKNNAFHSRPPRLISLGLKHHRHSAHSCGLKAFTEHSDALAAQTTALFYLELFATVIGDAHTERGAASTEAPQK